MDKIIALGITFIFGMFIMIGAIIALRFKNGNKLINFSFGLAFGVMTMLAIFDILPEAYEMLSVNYSGFHLITVMFLAIFLGLLILKLLDLYIPEHDNKNIKHIETMGTIAIVLHNIIEGMALYGTLLSSIKLGILVCIGVGLHNIPLGLTISAMTYKTNKSKKKTYITMGLISLSTLLGGLLMLLFNSLISEFALGILLSLTLGMILYITIFELFPHIKASKDKNCYTGILIGILIIIISSFI